MIAELEVYIELNLIQKGRGDFGPEDYDLLLQLDEVLPPIPRAPTTRVPASHYMPPVAVQEPIQLPSTNNCILTFEKDVKRKKQSTRNLVHLSCL